MTNEETIKWLNQMLDIDFPYKPMKDALDMAIRALSQEPTVQDKQAESEKYQKAFDDGYANGYEQARFDYEQEPCDDAISRDAVLKQIFYSTDNNGDVVLGSTLRRRIENLPSVTQKSGKWIDDEFGSKCSCCGIHTHLDKFDRPMKFKYCSMCGAKMESEE